ncbi:phage DNA ejection protein [Salmonella enterica]|nr:hypothetical protein [Salmonella enterica subsp. diarizonae]EGV3635459.1 hypothetical protein [Salmonella enterica]EKL0442667.1 phage DNA ejection protein [Salmonella enterica]HCM1889063.1 phage DNA ejection protein [Salmonella enterica subsp. diarizonae serovar 57:c:z]
MAVGERYAAGFGQVQNAITQGAKLGAGLVDDWNDSYNKAFDAQDHQNEILRRNAARKAFGDAWASGDPKAVDSVMQQFPEFAQRAQQFIGIRDDQHRKDLGSLMSEISALAQAGDYQGVLNLVNKSGNVLDADSSTLLKNIAMYAASADSKTAAGAQQKLIGAANGIAKLALTPAELSSEQIRLQRQAETRLRDQQAHDDRIRGQKQRSKDIRYRVNHPAFAGALTASQQQQRASGVRMTLGDDKKRMSAARAAGQKALAYLNSNTSFGDANAMLLTQIIDNPRASAKIGHVAESYGMTADGLWDKFNQFTNGLISGSSLTDQDRNAIRKIIQIGMDEEVNNYNGEAQDQYTNLINDGVTPSTASEVTGVLPGGGNIFTKDYKPATNNIPATPPSGSGVATEPHITPIDTSHIQGGNPHTGKSVQGRSLADYKNSGAKAPNNIPDGTVNKNYPDYVAYNGYWYKKAGKK